MTPLEAGLGGFIVGVVVAVGFVPFLIDGKGALFLLVNGYNERKMEILRQRARYLDSMGRQ